MKYVDNLFDWAVGVYDDYCNDSIKIDRVIDTDTGITIVYDLRTGKTAFSKCKKGEEFSEEIGVAIAYARLKGREVPQVRKKVLVKNLTVGEKFSRITFPNYILYVIGINPLKSTETIAVSEKTGKLFRLDIYEKVYKMD